MNGRNGRLYFIHALTPIRVGVGAGLGAINLPTAREATTGLPLIPGSSIKGVLRAEAVRHFGGRSWDADVFEDDPIAENVQVCKAFGPDTAHADWGRGGLVVGDALLLALPVRTLVGMFAWVTSPYILRRLGRDLHDIAHSVGDEATPAAFPACPGDKLRVPAGRASALRLDGGGGGYVFLEDLILAAEVEPDGGPLAEWAGWLAQKVWPGSDDEEARAFFQDRVALVSDDLMRQLARTALEVRHRVKIDTATGTAAGSGPWMEEHIPTESLLFGAFWAHDVEFQALQRNADTRNPELRAEKEEEPDRRAPDPLTANANDVLDIVRTLGKGRPVLRFGGHTSVGLGRARFVL